MWKLIKEKFNRFKKWIVGFFLVPVAMGAGTVVVDRQIDPYIDRGTYEELSIVTDIPQGERVEISKTKAEITLRGWNDEYAIKVIPQIPTPAGQFGATRADFNVSANRPLLSKRMEYKSGDITAFIEPKEGTENEFDIDFILDSKPDTNVFTYVIEGADEFDFFYQPALTQEEIDEGTSRPENVVGSYAVYHKTKANHRVGSTNYATGKVAHIYRPKAIDNNGNEVWAVLNYNNGVLSVEVPQDFLDTAVYPVVVDPTFGYTTEGASDIELCDNVGSGNYQSWRVGLGVTLGEAGTLDSISAYLRSNSGSANADTYGALNNENTATDSHSEVALIESVNQAYTETAFLASFTASGESLSASGYVINVACDATDIGTGPEMQVRYDFVFPSGYNNYSEQFTTSSGYVNSQEDPWTETDGDSGQRTSLYATYTASGGGGGSTPVEDFWDDL